MRIEVAVNLQSGLHIFVSKSFADEQNVRTKLNQQAGMAMTNIVYPYLFNTALFADAFHLVIQKVLCHVKQPISVMVVYQPRGV